MWSVGVGGQAGNDVINLPNQGRATVAVVEIGGVLPSPSLRVIVQFVCFHFSILALSSDCISFFVVTPFDISPTNNYPNQ